jgi:hypothetical protein
VSIQPVGHSIPAAVDPIGVAGLSRIVTGLADGVECVSDARATRADETIVESATAIACPELPDVGPDGPIVHADGLPAMAEQAPRLPDQAPRPSEQAKRLAEQASGLSELPSRQAELANGQSETANCAPELPNCLSIGPDRQRKTLQRSAELIRLAPNMSPCGPAVIRRRAKDGHGDPGFGSHVVVHPRQRESAGARGCSPPLTALVYSEFPLLYTTGLVGLFATSAMRDR